MTIHPSTLPTFLAYAYSIPPSDLRTHDYLHKLHLRGWSGVAYDYSDHTATIEAGTKFDALGAGGEACISWFKRMVAGGKVERGICGVKLKQGELIWKELPEVKVEVRRLLFPSLTIFC